MQHRVVNTTIFFDYESTWGMPAAMPYDLASATTAVLGVLERHGASAVFNTTGKIVEDRPELITRIARAGHEIAIHGYDHTNPAHMTAADNRQFEADLARVEAKIVELTGTRPVGFRSPHLGAPRFFDAATYDIFERRGYAWASNREIRFVDEATSPHVTGRGDVIGLAGKLIGRLGLDRVRLLRRIGLVLLNLDLVWRDQTRRPASRVANLVWLVRRPAPFRRRHLTEFPVLSPLDVDFLSARIDPAQPSPQSQVDHMVNSLCRLFDEAEEHFNLNFHDWIIGTSNRIDVLDRTVAYIAASGRARWVLAREGLARRRA
ncbi:polysaccharide deacetylase family protein [Dactylosporangium sp. NPDC048998]|uniref:polysaccharide deacetylase family protein n=1 Tax=Dactylosporangium sp. NPDC048998 TaxID=3363976 RepID=UPI003719EECB